MFESTFSIALNFMFYDNKFTESVIKISQSNIKPILLNAENIKEK